MDFDVSTVLDIVGVFTEAGPKSINVLLTAVILILIYDRRQLVKLIDQKESRLDVLTDEHSDSNLALAESLQNLKSVLSEIRMKVD